MSRVIDEHRQYLLDDARVAAFAAAIAETVRPGDVVLDLASGTGILGLLACRAGAREVYAVDAGGMAHPAREIAAANGFADRLHVIDGHSREVTLPSRADVLVTDQIGHFGFETGLVGDVADARRRHLAANARYVPQRVSLAVAPVEAPDVAAAVRFWNEAPGGFDMRPLFDPAANSGYPRTLQPEQVLGDPATGATIALDQEPPRPLSVQARLVISRGGVMHGIAGWFDAALSPRVTMTNSPLSADRINRRAAVFPVWPEVPVAPGDVVSVAMRIIPDDAMVGWTVEVTREGRPISRMSRSTLRGMLIRPERLARTSPDHLPKLTARGRARLTVLELCDGHRDLRAVEREVFARHHDLFADEADAAHFVAEVVVGYTE